MNESTQVPRKEWESDLDWLARNVHVWPAGDHQPWCYVYMAHGGVMKAAGNFLDAVAKPTMITIDQWLARRAELQNKPSWDGARKWANWLGQDEDGAWWYFSAKPKCQSRSFGEMGSGICADFAGAGEVLGDWRDTLEKRPEVEPEISYNLNCEGFVPFVSVEDAKVTIMQSEGDVKRFGGIIGRSLPLEEDAATAKQQAPKGSGNPILGMVLADLTNRALEGKKKYGEPLLAHNGRNALWDLYQELLDAAMYIRQVIEEQK